MIKKLKFKLIICSLITLIPSLFGVCVWNKLPEKMPIHWDINGAVDSFAPKAVAVFLPPLLLLAVFWICILVEAKIGKNGEIQNKKAFGLVLFLLPAISVVLNAFVYSTALGVKISLRFVLPFLMGGMLMIIGNYMPKCRQNKTLGIKIKWTLENEENWNATHRFAGKVWFVGGFVTMLCVLLPERIFGYFTLGTVLIFVLIPAFYSYIYHKKQLKGDNR